MTQPFPNYPIPQDLTYEFLGTFARCEYALKCSSFAKSKRGSVEANWDDFAKSIDRHFCRIVSVEFQAAVNLLLTEPPRKQVLLDGRLSWKDSPPDKRLPIAQQALLMVRRIRNNLFHGAKIWVPEYGNRNRDIQLLRASLIVLKQSFSIIGEVQAAYEYGMF